ncbi:MAG: NAD(P)H-hydrate dehydratase [Bacteroidetes bacterium]|nr:NAD(P)H-hydrate dehydratase [Bacteroidota bacterium]
MQPLLSSSQIRDIDTRTIRNQKLNSRELMFRVGSRCALSLRKYLSKDIPVDIVCGTGNNGGDGLVISIVLNRMGFFCRVWKLHFSETATEDFLFYEQVVRSTSGIDFFEIKNADYFSPGEQIVDSIFGTGLKRPVTAEFEKIITTINSTAETILSVDIPSGIPVNGDFFDDNYIRASRTFTFQFPKLALLLPEFAEANSFWEILDIGLEPVNNNWSLTNFFLWTKEDAALSALHRNKHMHKGSGGHLLIVAGSEGMAGAALLSAKSAILSGCGLTTLHSIKTITESTSNLIPDVLTSTDENPDRVSVIPVLNKSNTTAIGPGLSVKEELSEIIKNEILEGDSNLVLDADALNNMANDPDWRNWYVSKRPKHIILTPHLLEFDRLFGQHSNTLQRIQTATEFCISTKSVIVLKGAYTVVVDSKGLVTFNNSGTPAMAKGGSGDVLTGVIGSMLARGYDPEIAARLGVYIHGLAGEIAEKKYSSESVCASGIIESLPEAFSEIYKGFSGRWSGRI